ncbi:MAG: Gx transporter family protein [Firmicutes bacterium]|nr:Gx transporter family protein [Bacillota bacterium]MBQ9973179.1 Gx transporter family protein [Bacillota bacterium]
MVLCGVLVALAAIFSYIEAMIPIAVGIPGVKLGFANIVVVFALYKIDFKSALAISFVRILIMSALFGNPTMALYSLAGGMLSIFVMQGLKMTKIFSIFGVSMAGGVFHNVGQVLMAVLVMETKGLFAYLAPLVVIGELTGLFIGFVTSKALEHLRQLRV